MPNLKIYQSEYQNLGSPLVFEVSACRDVQEYAHTKRIEPFDYLGILLQLTIFSRFRFVIDTRLLHTGRSFILLETTMCL